MMFHFLWNFSIYIAVADTFNGMDLSICWAAAMKLPTLRDTLYYSGQMPQPVHTGGPGGVKSERSLTTPSSGYSAQRGGKAILSL